MSKNAITKSIRKFIVLKTIPERVMHYIIKQIKFLQIKIDLLVK